MLNYYALLGVRPDASSEEVKSAYRQAVRQAHPDLHGEVEDFHQIQAAYTVLRDPAQRTRYDEARRDWMRHMGAVGCASCGHANRITRRPSAGETVRCWHCRTPLRLAWDEFVNAQRQSLLRQSTQFVEEVGGELADLASDAVRAGIARLRLRVGLGLKTKSKQ